MNSIVVIEFVLRKPTSLAMNAMNSIQFHTLQYPRKIELLDSVCFDGLRTETTREHHSHTIS